MNLSQAALSHRIKKLESDVGLSLLQRTTRTVRLTRAGQEFFPKARDMMSRLSDLYDDLKIEGQRSHQRVAVGCLSSLGELFLPRPTAADFANLRIYGRYRFGRVLDIALLGIRQYRTPPEFVGGSLASDGPSDSSIAAVLAENPHIKFASGTDHGYAVMTLDGTQARTDFVVVSDRKVPDATASIKHSFVVMDGHPGVIRA